MDTEVATGDYSEKRDFDKTPEPKSRKGSRKVPEKRPKKKSPLESNRFVAHRHEARRLHYDFRLLIGDTLCSWAVPKGFSYNPNVKRLAVRTEDHPVEYLSFEGMIPKGEYGAGAIEIWDSGSYEILKGSASTALAEGDLKLALDGTQLRGEWHLFRTGDENWLLLKAKDDYSRDTDHLLPLSIHPERLRREKIPKKLPPMTPATTVAPFSDPAWLYELDFDGQRVMAGKSDGRGFVYAGNAGASDLIRVNERLAELRCSSAILDGVLVALDDSGRPSNEALLHAREGDGDQISLYVFDILHWDGFSTRDLPLSDRKELLRSILPPSDRVMFVDSVSGRGEKLAGEASQAGVGNIVAKVGTSPYVSGPSKHWRRLQTAKFSRTATRAAVGPTPRIKLSNPGKVYWPEHGYTKRDLYNYYDAVAEYLVPHLAHRPVHMQRFPNGIAGKQFYQRQAPEHAPDWVATVDFGKKDERYIVCNDRWTLLYLVNLGSIHIHPWLSRADSPDTPDWVVVDIDAKNSSFGNAVRVSRKVGSLLRGLGLRSYIKTSGGTGLHIYVPIAPEYTYEHSRMFAEGVARFVVMENANLATVERNPQHRKDRIYIDFLQNRRGQTIVPPYSARPVPGARVSMPLHWDELHVDLSPDEFTIMTATERLSSLGDLFRPVLNDKQDLTEAITSLADYARDRGKN